jgi:hypothetical protein
LKVVVKWISRFDGRVRGMFRIGQGAGSRGLRASDER